MCYYRRMEESQIKKNKDDFGYDFEQTFDPNIKKEKPDYEIEYPILLEILRRNQPVPGHCKGRNGTEILLCGRP